MWILKVGAPEEIRKLIFKHSFKPASWVLNACGKLGKSHNFLIQLCSLSLVYKCLSYLKREETGSFSTWEQTVLEIHMLYISCSLHVDTTVVPILQWDFSAQTAVKIMGAGGEGVHLSEKGLFHVWAVLACFSVEILDSLFQVQGKDRKFLVVKLRCGTESYLFIHKKRVFMLK